MAGGITTDVSPHFQERRGRKMENKTSGLKSFSLSQERELEDNGAQGARSR